MLLIRAQNDSNMTPRLRRQLAKIPTAPLLMTGVLLLGLGLIYTGWQLSSVGNLNPSDFTPQRPASHANLLTQADFNKIYTQDISPLINTYNKRNLKAASRAIQLINLSFDRYRARAPKFASDMTSITTQFQTMGWLVADKWDSWIYGKQDVNRIARHTREMFAKDVLSQDQLQHVVQAALGQFRRDVQANQNTLLSQVKIVLVQNKLYTAAQFEGEWFKTFSDHSFARLNSALKGTGTKSLGMNLATMAGSTIAAIATEQIVRSILTYMATNLTVTAAVEGGPLVAGAAAGGGGGSTLGPAGTLIGAAAGLIVGGAIAYVMQSHFENKMTLKCKMALTRLQRNLLYGPPRGAKAMQSVIQWQGLKNVLITACDQLNKNAQESMHKTLVKGQI